MKKRKKRSTKVPDGYINSLKDMERNIKISNVIS